MGVKPMETLDAFFPRKEYVEMRQVYPVESDWFEVPITYQPSNRVVTRPYGSMPFVRPAPHDKSMLEIDKKCEQDVSDLYLKVLALYSHGYYQHGGWGRASNELGLLGRDSPSAEALRRDIKARVVVVPNKDGKSKIRMD
jgi:hypothetical protein